MKLYISARVDCATETKIRQIIHSCNFLQKLTLFFMHALGFFALPLAHVYYVLLCGQVRNFSFGLPHLSGRSYRPSHSCIHAHQILKNMLRGGCVLDLFGNCCGEQDANTTNKQNEKKRSECKRVQRVAYDSECAGRFPFARNTIFAAVDLCTDRQFHSSAARRREIVFP